MTRRNKPWIDDDWFDPNSEAEPPQIQLDGTIRPMPFKGDNFCLVQAGQVLIRGQRIVVDGVTYEVAEVRDGEAVEWPDERWETMDA